MGWDVGKVTFPGLLSVPDIKHGYATKHTGMIEELPIVVLPEYKDPVTVPVILADEILSIPSIPFT